MSYAAFTEGLSTAILGLAETSHAISFSVLTATLNLDEIIGGKFDLDVVGHYARPDIFKFEVKQ